jgi:hypothetical protein
VADAKNVFFLRIDPGRQSAWEVNGPISKNAKQNSPC